MDNAVYTTIVLWEKRCPVQDSFCNRLFFYGWVRRILNGFYTFEHVQSPLVQEKFGNVNRIWRQAELVELVFGHG